MQARKNRKKLDLPGLSEWLTVVRAYQTCDKVMNRRLAKAGLTVPQYDLLMSLMKKDGQTQQELADRMLVVKSNVSSLLSRAERDGLIARRENPSDARGKIVTLTPEGKRLAKRGWTVQSDVVSTMFEALTPGELQEIAQTMNRLREALQPLLDAD